MSYNIGQIKYNDLNIPSDVYVEYLINNPEGEYEDLPDATGTVFYPQLVYPNLVLQKNVAYFVRIYFKKIDAQQNITIHLRDSNNTISQKIKNFVVPARTDTSTTNESDINNPNIWVYFNFIFIPNQQGYTKITFDVAKTAYNVEKNLVGNMVLLRKIHNLITTKVKAKHNVVSLVKIGVQSRPGTLMCINGEEIRVGRTGFYEINSGVAIDYFGFGAELYDFILDYVYDTEATEGTSDIIDPDDDEEEDDPGQDMPVVIIDDSVISPMTTWSSSNIASKISWNN